MRKILAALFLFAFTCGAIGQTGVRSNNGVASGLTSSGTTLSGTTTFGASGAGAKVAAGANLLELLNGTTSQRLNIYGTFTDSSNYKRFGFYFSAGDWFMDADAAGTGLSGGDLRIRTIGNHSIHFATSATDRWRIENNGHLIGVTDNTYDIGTSGALRPRTGYFGTSVITPLVLATGMNVSSGFLTNNGVIIYSTNGVPQVAAPDGSIAIGTGQIYSRTNGQWVAMGVGGGGGGGGPFIASVSGMGNFTSLSEPGILDELNFGDTNGGLGKITFSPGPGFAYLLWSFVSNGVPLRVEIPGDVYSKFHGDASALSVDVMAGATNAVPGRSNVIADIYANTIDLGPVSAGGAGTITNLIGIGTASNVVQVTIGTGLRVRPTGANTAVIESTGSGGGGGASAVVFTNLYVRDTNALIINPALAQTWSFGGLTNGTLLFSNAPSMTNLALHDIEVNWHQWTNGGTKPLAIRNVSGNFTTNGTWTPTTNANATDKLIFRLADATMTNIVMSVITNSSSYVDTNSLLTAGGGGGGSTGLFPSDSVTLNWLLNNSLADASGNGNTATYSGPGATYVADESGSASHALSFNGTSEYIEAASSSVFNPTTADFSIVIYMTNTITDFSSSPVILGNGVFGNTGLYMQQHVAFGGNALAAEVTVSWHDGGGDKTIASTDRDVLPNVNYCIVFVRNGTSGKIYVNGVDQTQAAQPTIGTIASSASKFTVGKYLGGSNFLPAKVQQVIIYSRALTPTEVSTGSAGPSQ